MGRGFTVQLRFVSGEEIGSITPAALHSGAEVIVAAGGDGTISAVASELVGTGVPLGTMNHFARDIGLPLAIEDAAHTIAELESRFVDVAEVNAHYFINNSSIGTYPAIVRARESGTANGVAGKKAATVVATLKTFYRLPLIHTWLVLNGKVLSRFSPFVFVGNNVYTLRLGSGELRQRLDAGVLSVVTTRAQTAAELAGLAWLALRNRLSESVQVERWQTPHMEIRTHRRQIHVSLDGEVCTLTSPLHYRTHPLKLR